MTTTPPSDPFLGKVFDGRYRVDELIARGGMATVYRGTDTRLGRTVALKVLAGLMASDPDFVERFIQEARATAALTHPNVVAVHDQGIAEGFPYLVMEFVQGRTIREIMAQTGPFASAHALEILSSVLAGLSAAHEAGFVHRDIKPENILITANGHIKVTDFGLARVISDTPVSDSTGGVLLGTMAYLSPEQVQQATVDQRSDVYSSGILLYEMVTGSVPFTGTSPLDVAYQHVNSSVPAPSALQHDIPPAVDHLVLSATGKAPNERFQDASEFREGVLRAITAVPPAEALTAAIPLQQTQIIPALMRGSDISAGALPVTKSRLTEASGADLSGGSKNRISKRVIASLLALIVLVGGGTWYKFSGGYEIVPDVVGKSVDQARALLSPSNLTANVVEQFSEDIPPGIVISTEPASGQKARKSKPITLSISKGKERYIIPSDLVGQDPNAAKKILETLTLVASGTNQVYDDNVAVGKVVGTDPAAGKQVKRGTPVTILVSKGPAPVTVPALFGINIADATTSLATIGLSVKITDQIYNESPEGSIITADPAPGATVPKGTEIKVTVSKGPPLVAVPNVVGMDVAAATAKLTAAGFQVKTVNKLPVAILNKVYSQVPGGGGQAPRGSLITLEIV